MIVMIREAWYIQNGLSSFESFITKIAIAIVIVKAIIKHIILFGRCLTVKNWLVHKKRKIELAPKRTWKKYWLCLKGTALMFYACDDNETVPENSMPRHMLGK